ncbi:p-loop domain-containing protein [Desulfonema limicola]|uniref:P-loop domain-containing protein n=1 Tax=Desulfonema limicola TaxID=45656 RepID=A0A975BDS1_9BACT|nr:p-loop domain-containing protein [Desulfonema limicola]
MKVSRTVLRGERDSNVSDLPGGMGNEGLRHFMVIEEAHRLLKNVNIERTTEMMGNPKGKAVEVFCNILAEMRSLGQGVAVVEQIPSKISPDVIKNSNTKIVHRLVSKDDQSLLAGSLSIDDYDALYLNRLKTGHALCYKEGMGRPVECAVLNDVDSHAISDGRIKKLMATLTPDTLQGYQAYQIDAWLGKAGKELVIKLFNSLVTTQSNDPDKLIVAAKEELKKLLVLEDVPYRINDSLFSDYFTLQVMVLLNKGIYCRKNPIPGNLKTMLLNVVNKPNEKSKKQLVDALSSLWKPVSAKGFIEDVIESLSVRYLYQKRSEANLTEIRSVVSSFLLLEDEDTTNKISLKVQIKMEDTYA